MDIFEYVITEGGDIYPAKSQAPQLNQFQLRSSIKSSSNFGMGGMSTNTNSIYTNSTLSSSSNSLNQSQNVNQNLSPNSQNQPNVGSPKINKSYEINYE